MELYILSPLWGNIGIIDEYNSLSWVERHYEAGDFELELPITQAGNPLLVLGNYVMLKDSDILMQIQEILVNESEENSNVLVRGADTKSLLKQRWFSSTFIHMSQPGDIAMAELVSDHLVYPDDNDRDFPGMEIGPIPGTGATYENIFDSPMTIYDMVTTIGKATQIGYKLVDPDLDDYPISRLQFQVVPGTNRYREVVFAKSYDNVISSSNLISKKSYVNVVGVLTDDLTYPFTWVAGRYSDPLPGDVPKWASRYEKTISISIDRTATTPPLSNYDVMSIIKTAGRKEIDAAAPKAIYEAEVDIYGRYKYNVDYFMGDIVLCFLQGNVVSARLVELGRTYSADTNSAYATLDFEL